MGENGRKIYLDILNIIACLMVVFFHCNMIFYEFSDTLSWKISVVERCVVYSAVPIFFMITGANLLCYREKYSTKEFAKKRLIRTGIPFLFWNVFYIVFLMALGNFKFNSVTKIISAFLNSEFMNRYWFFFPLFAVYAAIPVISLVLKVPNHRKYLWYMVALGFIFSYFLKPIFYICGIKYNNDMSFPLTGGFIIQAIFGYLVATGQWRKKYRLLLYAVTVFSEVFVIFYTIKTSVSSGETNLFLISYRYFPSVLMAASLFVFFRHLNYEKVGKKIQNFLKTLSSCNMGVWLTHSLGILVFQELLRFTDDSYIFRFAIPFAVYAVCALGTFIAKKIPIAKYVV